MALNIFKSRSFTVLYVLAGLAALAWIAGETHFTFAIPDEDKRDELIEQALDGASKTFSAKELDLLNDTERLANSIKGILNENDAHRMYRRINTSGPFWGVTVFKNRQQFVWTGNPVTILPDATSDSLYVTISQSGQVLFFVCQRTLFDSDRNRYDLVTTRLIRRTGASPVLLTEHVDITENWSAQQVYPVNFKFFDLDITPAPAQKIALNTASVDSVGYVTASIADFPALEREWHRSMVHFRYIMLFTGLLLLFLFASNVIRYLPRERQPALYAVLAGVLWIVTIVFEIPFPRLLSPDTSVSGYGLAFFARDSLFAALILLMLSLHLRRNPVEGSSPKILTTVPLTGLFTGFAGAWIFTHIHNTIMETETGLLSLSVNPDAGTWIMYLGTFFLAGAFLCLLFNTIRKRVLQTGYARAKSMLLYFIPFLMGTLSVILWMESEIGYGLWLRFVLSCLVIGVVSSFDKGWLNESFLPAPRLISLTVLVSVALTLPVFFDAEILKENQEMVRMAMNYSETNEEQAELITRVLLQNLSSDPGIQQIQTVDAYPTFPIHAAAQFRRRVNQLIEPDWGSYTILAFLLDGRLNVITDFGSQPAFSDRFSSSFYEEVRAFIRHSLQKPFARLPIVESDPRFKGFPVFLKGLQSIPSDFPSQPSWLVTFVLVEGTSFGRPIHDALVFHERDRDNWNRFILTEYVDGLKTRTTAAARAPIYPVHHTLTEFDAPDSGEKIRFRRVNDPTSVRQLLYRHDDRVSIIATVRDQTILNLIFSGFRFFISILILSLAAYQIRKFVSNLNAPSQSKNKQRLHDRILDSYLLATLLFLVALAFVTEFIVSRQNLTIAEQELSRNLALLENRIYQQETGESDIGAFDNQDIDIILYDNGRLAGTTAPEIFRLQLLSDFMPFEAYDKIYHQNVSTFFQQSSIGNLPVLLGFRALFENQQVRRVVAIPAYTRSAAYEEEFLQTTSYLIAFYIIIFVFFTGGAWLVSRRLTQPLSEFQTGLQQISSGNLDTTIPVSSDDEIGELARAYNQMVRDLKGVRQELAVAEREAAWSEMARQIAHEIKNPLTPMKLSIQHLQRQIATGTQSMDELRPNIERLTNLLVTQIESLNKISADFSKFAKPLDGVFEHTDLNLVIRKSIQLFDHQENVDINYSSPSEDIIVRVIPEEINRVFINLIKNGLEACNGEARINIHVETTDYEAHIYITDNGEGIPGENADRIFTPNFSTKTSGTGLGLAICKKIMEAHKGSIAFSSSDRNGTTFELILPLAKHA